MILIYLIIFSLSSIIYSMDPHNKSVALKDPFSHCFEILFKVDPTFNQEFNFTKFVGDYVKFHNLVKPANDATQQVTNIPQLSTNLVPKVNPTSEISLPKSNQIGLIKDIIPLDNFRSLQHSSYRNPAYNREYSFREYLEYYADHSKLRPMDGYEIIKNNPQFFVLLNSKVSDTNLAFRKSLDSLEAYASTSIDTGITEYMLDILKLEIPCSFYESFLRSTRIDVLKVICDKDGMLCYRKDYDTLKTISQFKREYETSLKYWESLTPRLVAAEIIEPIPMQADEALSKYLNNKDNQNFQRIKNLCDNDNFTEAYQIVQNYQVKVVGQKSIKEHDRQAYEFAYRLYYDKFNAHFDEYGIQKEYSTDPLYKELKKGLEPTHFVPNEKVNMQLAERSKLYNEIKTNLSIDDSASSVKKVLYDLVDVTKKDELAVAKYLAQNLNADSSDPAIRNAYKAFYYENGLPKVFSDSNKQVLELKMPQAINTAEYAKERAMLFELIASPATGNRRLVAEQGVQFLQKACSQDQLASTYRSLVHSSYHAFKQNDPMVLEHCMKSPHSSLQQNALPVIAKIYSDLYNQTPSSTQDRNILNRSLKTMDTLYGAALQGSEQAEKFLQSIVGPQEIVLSTNDGQLTGKAYIKTPSVEESVAFLFELEKSYQVVVEAKTLAQRIQALEQYKKEGDIRQLSVIELSARSKEFLQEVGISPVKLEIMQTNALQKEIQQEFADITEKTVQYYYKHYTKDAATINAKLVDIGVDYARENNIAQAHIISDCCNKILGDIKDWINYLPYPAKRALIYSEAFLQGAAEGVINTATYIKDNPIEAALTARFPRVMIPYHIGKSTYQALTVAYDHLSQVDYKMLTSDDIKAKFNELYDDFCSVSGPELLRGAAALSTQLALEGKAIQAVSSASTKGLALLIEEEVQTLKSIRRPTLVAAGEGEIRIPIAAYEHEESKLIDHLARDSNSFNKPKNNEVGFKGKITDIKTSQQEIKTGIKLNDTAIATLEKINVGVGPKGAITNKMAREAANILGFEQIGERSKTGALIFRKGNKYISTDDFRHNGGFWKMANSVDELMTKTGRLGTFDIFLNKIGD